MDRVNAKAEVPSTILVAEDDVMLLIVVAETLRDAGFEVVEASSGEAAVKCLKELPNIGLVISDIEMPGMKGYEVVRAGLALRPDLKVVLMTGYTHKPIPARFTKANVPVLYKPFDFEMLPDLARTILESRPSI